MRYLNNVWPLRDINEEETHGFVVHTELSCPLGRVLVHRTKHLPRSSAHQHDVGLRGVAQKDQ